MNIARTTRQLAAAFVATGCMVYSGCGASKPADTAQAKFRPVDEDEKTGSATAQETGGEKPQSKPVRIEQRSEETGSSTQTPDNGETSVKDVPNQETPTKKPPNDNSAKTAKKAPPKEEAPVPPGPLGEKVKELRRISTLKPTGRSEQQKIQSLIKILDQRLAVSDEILADASAPEAIKTEALVAQVEVYSMHVGLQLEEGMPNLERAADALANVSDPKSSIKGKATLFQLATLKAFGLKPQDGKAIVASIENLLKEGDDMIVLQSTMMAAQQMGQLGFSNDAADAFALIGDHFANNSDPQIAAMASGLQVTSLVSKLQLAKDDEKTELGDALVAKLKTMASDPKTQLASLELVMEVGQMLESNENFTVAKQVYDLLESSYKDNENEKLAAAAVGAAENGRKRIALIGKPFEVVGETLAGGPINWSEYAGKIVLVDFWATWCGPCLEELPNIMKNYKKYHAQGFEVVGINLDDDQQDVTAFFDKNGNLPWTTVLSNEPGKLGMENALAVKAGVNAIPFVILIGRDGKVLGIHVRGPRLGKELEKLLAKSDGSAPTEGDPKEEEEPAKTGSRDVDTSNALR